ncbi:hypothetical protein GCM10010298_67790 [Streptomyces microflavus]|uniref:Uncharacterized protein n=1 Tax=Streptomyces microflavus TaxID=1919 RepID=A0A7J0D791_STRMI|nr:hypothetical protein Smic_85130 [Streptomyces microflavus]GGX92997.1 hypothetical protein GCM10010298_67790 [Streptomyces microflavus]
MRDHDVKLFGAAAEEFGGPFERPGVGEPVEAVAAQPVLLAPPGGHRVLPCGGGQAGVEDGVEAGGVRDVGQQVSGGVQHGEGLRDVQRREIGQLVQPGAHLVVDQGVAAQLRPAVDEPMPDGHRRGCFVQQRPQRPRSVLAGRGVAVVLGKDLAAVTEHGQTQTGRSGIGHQDRAVALCAHVDAFLRSGSTAREAPQPRCGAGMRRTGYPPRPGRKPSLTRIPASSWLKRDHTDGR